MADTIGRLNAALADRYRIEREVDRGGMATVYVADDLRHGRRVAFKVLHPELAAAIGGDRFLAEIRTTAGLQHPHILPLFDSGEVDGVLYYVMPYVQGESLRARLEREGPLPVEDALAIATKVAGALHAAHERGVIHRDVKPANILLADGEPLVADFGIALAVREGGGGRLTETGLSLGTPRYMSPEQASGDQPVGPAADVWAIGCVLYEMLTGEAPFAGRSARAVLSRILTEPAPSVSALRPSVPPNVEATLARSLERLPPDRFRSAADFARALGDPAFRHGGQANANANPQVRRWRRVALAALGTAALLAAGLVAGGFLRNPEAGRPVVRSSLEPPPGISFAPGRGFAISPDGRRLAFVAGDEDGPARLWVQSLDAATPRALSGTEGAWRPFWSPDGQHIAFFADGDLKRIPSAGGAIRVLHSPNPQPKGGTWSPDGRIVFVPDYRTGLVEITEDGGEPRPLTELDPSAGELSHRHPAFAPDGKSILFLVQTHEYGSQDDRSRIEVLTPDGRRREILPANSSFAYTAPGTLLYWRDGAVYATALDPSTWRTDGASQIVAEGVGFDVNEYAFLSASAEGTLVHHRGNDVPWHLAWRDSSGKTLSVVAEEADFSDPEISPDGGRVAYVHDSGVWVLDLARGTRTRISFEDGDHFSPTWSPDGGWIAYSGNRDPEAGTNIYRRAASGLGDRELVFEGVGSQGTQDLHWSPAGGHIALEEEGELFLLDVESGQRRALGDGPGFATWTRFSPDGRLLAYASNATGRFEIYVLPVEGTPRKVQVSKDGGQGPVWSPAGDALYFIGPQGDLRRVRVLDAEELELEPPEVAFEVGQWFNFDIAPDGRFLISTASDLEGAENFRLTLNWPGLLNR